MRDRLMSRAQWLVDGHDNARTRAKSTNTKREGAAHTTYKSYEQHAGGTMLIKVVYHSKTFAHFQKTSVPI